MGERHNQINKKIINYGLSLYLKYPPLQPYLKLIKKIFFKPRFSGWGMTTEHELPWINEYDEEIFRKASQDIKKQFQFNKRIVGIDSRNVDALLWRHWNVSYAIRYAIRFSDTNEHNFVECGVGEGFSAFFALREIRGQQKIVKKFSMHLYDSWNAMKKEQLLKSELLNVNKYSELEVNITKKNLSEFNDYIIYHQGYIPESFNVPPEAPNSIVYLHIDLNSSQPTLSTLEFFYPRLVKGGVILFDDYGWLEYGDTKKKVDAFFYGKPGIIMKLPTGQAIYHR